MTDLVTATLDGAVATLTLNRPDRLNALNPGVFAALHAAIDTALAGGARALVLTGAGRFFSAGADIQPDGPNGFLGTPGLPDDLGALIDAHYNPLVQRLAALDVPLITALNGPAAGAGLSLALCGDIVVAAESSYLLLAFVNIGLVPDAGATWLVARSVGRARALEMALLGERLSAREAHAAGLVTRVTPDNALLAEAQAIAARLAAGPARAIAMIRHQVAAALDLPFGATLELERDNQRLAGRTADFAEALAAFAAKRAPRFVGA